MKIDIEQQIAEVARECALRKNVYPQFVARGKMEQTEADNHAARMEAALGTLKWVRDNREKLISLMKEGQ